MIALPLLCLAGLVAAAVLLSRARHGTLYGFRKSSRTSHTSLVFQSPELPSCGSNPDGAAHAGGCAQATDGQQEQRTVGNVLKEGHKPPTLRIIIMVAGTRGDVQPAVALALRLQQDGHRVRLATHTLYEAFARKAGVSDFFPLAGNPQALTQVAIESGGMLPKRLSAFQRVRAEYADIIASTWEAVHSCQERPSLIITTPITYGAAHVAEALGGVPLHVISAVPWLPSKQVPHPWARAWDLSVPEIVAATLNMLLPSVHHACAGDQHDSPAPQLSGSSATVQHPATVPLLDNMINPRMHLQAAHRVLRTVLARYTSWRERLCAFLIQGAAWASTPLLDHCVWLGIADLLAVFRSRTLGLWPLGGANHGWALYRHPTTFTFSPLLLPPGCTVKPPDWGDHVAVTGPLLLPHTPVQQQQQQQQPQQQPTECSKPQSSSKPHAAGLSSANGSAVHCGSSTGSSSSSSSSAVTISWGGILGRASSLLPASLEAFLEAGPPPVYVSFGSACDMDVPFLVDSICRAAVSSDTRVLLSRSMLRGAAACKGAWGQALLRGVQPDQGTMFEVDGRHHTCSTACGAAHGAPTSQRAAHSARSQRCMGLELGKHVFLVEELPHNLILPRCCGAIVHGGIGHVLSCLANGCPLLVTPCYGDHFSWAEAVFKAGYGPPPIPASQISQEKLENALMALRNRGAYAVAAWQAKQQLESAPRGVDLAVAHIYRHLPLPTAAPQNDSTSNSQPCSSLLQLQQDMQQRSTDEWGVAIRRPATLAALWAGGGFAVAVRGIIAILRVMTGHIAAHGNSGRENYKFGDSMSSKSGGDQHNVHRDSKGYGRLGLRWVPWPIGDGCVRM